MVGLESIFNVNLEFFEGIVYVWGVYVRMFGLVLVRSRYLFGVE